MRFFTIKKKKPKVTSLQLLVLSGTTVSYTFIVSKKAKHLRISISTGGELRVTAPLFLSEEKVKAFILKKSSWILSKLLYYKNLPPPTPKNIAKKEYEENKEKAYTFVQEKLTKWNALYAYTYNTVRIKNHTTLWGSCSRKRNLNFNYKIINLPEKLADYIIVHELCHLKEFNHADRFWNLVALTIPNHKELRRELRATGLRSQ